MRRLALTLCLLTACLTACGDQTLIADGRPETPSPTVDATACPATVSEPLTPPTSTRVQGNRLVPEGVPESMLLCRYEEKPPVLLPSPGYVPTYHLSGGRDISGLEKAADQLQLPPKVSGESHACTAMGGPSFPFLVRLQYADRTVWLATKSDVNSCAEVTNGSTTSSAYLGGDLQATYDASTWTRGVRRAASCNSPLGRYGQHETLLPEGAVRIRVCREQEELAPVTDADTISQITALFNGKRTTPGQGGCSGQITHSRELLAEYASGRGVGVHVLQGCEPNAFTSSLATQLSDDDVQRVFRLIDS